MTLQEETIVIHSDELPEVKVVHGAGLQVPGSTINVGTGTPASELYEKALAFLALAKWQEYAEIKKAELELKKRRDEFAREQTGFSYAILTEASQTLIDYIIEKELYK